MIAADSSNLGGLITASNSIVENTKHPVQFYFVTPEDDTTHLRVWIDSTKLHRIKYEIHGFPSELGPGVNYAKISIPDLFPEIKGKLLYLDNDVIVQGDIWELYNTPILQNHYGVFSEECSSTSKRFGFGVARYVTHINLQNTQVAKLNLDPAACPFSAGVFLINVTLWRQEKLTDKLQHWIDVNERESILGIQPAEDETEAAMLIVFYHKISPMDPMWHVRHLGVTTGSRYSKQFLEKAKLLHWSGHFKPWGRQSSYVELWDRYYIPDPTAQFRPVRKRG